MTAGEQFRSHVQSIQEHAGLRLSESDTRAYLVDPLLRILGYEGVRHLRREVSVPATKEFIDYALLVDGDARALVEAKALRHTLGDQHVAQCVQYASILGVRWCLITNGVTWVVYDAHAKGPLADKRVAEVQLDGDEATTERAWQVLSMFSREALAASSPLTALLIDRVVADELRMHDSGAINALRKAVRVRFGERVSGEAVVASIARLLDAALTTPPVASVADSAHELSVPVARNPTAAPSSSEPRRTRPRSPEAPSRVSLADLVAGGLLQDGSLLEAQVHGVTHVARVRDGGLEVNGVHHRSPSAASKVIRGTISWNGWIDWRHGGETLDEMRTRYLESRTGADNAQPG